MTFDDTVGIHQFQEEAQFPGPRGPIHAAGEQNGRTNQAFRETSVG